MSIIYLLSPTLYQKTAMQSKISIVKCANYIVFLGSLLKYPIFAHQKI